MLFNSFRGILFLYLKPGNGPNWESEIYAILSMPLLSIKSKVFNSISDTVFKEAVLMTRLSVGACAYSTANWKVNKESKKIFSKQPVYYQTYIISLRSRSAGPFLSWANCTITI